ncbi:MAG: glycosyltransferase family 2 protein, partial [Candidatus Nanopelagicales bacterium]|nr:glycosyltransferase family 2 protein [Candidatus Nanopelagicales bacterium]
MVRRLLPVFAVGAVALTAHAAWNRRILRRPTPVDEDITESIAVHIPARNEVDALGDALASVQRQRGVPQTTIHVLDDGSSDGTAEIAERAAADDPRVHVTRAPDEAPPPGWLGKNFACARLAESTPDASVLVFMDADVVLQPDALNALVHHLRSESADLVAPYPRQSAGSWLERLVQPLLAWSWMTTVPLG